MTAFVYSIFGMAVLGVLVDILDSGKNTLIGFVYDLIVLLVVVTNIFNLLNSYIF